MKTKQRNAIVKKVKCKIDKLDNYSDMLPGEKEVIQDEYIALECIELGYSLSNFYVEDGKKLNKILSILN